VGIKLLEPTGGGLSTDRRASESGEEVIRSGSPAYGVMKSRPLPTPLSLRRSCGCPNVSQ
jgi:hypothetical protein